MKVLVIAQVAHEINRAYCASLGDNSQPEWGRAPEWQQQSAMAGVEMHLANPDATPEQSHESWLAQKVADGWVYGEVKDAAAKQHPCCVPYEDLPPEQKAKDYLFRAVVHNLKDIVTVDELEKVKAVAAAVAPAGEINKPGTVAVQYVGRRPEWTDTIYKTGLYFVADQVRRVPYELARKLLRHADLFARYEEEQEPQDEQGNDEDGDTTPPDDDTEALLAQAKAKEDGKRDELTKIQELHDQIERMDAKASLLEFAKVNYKHELKQRDTIAALRQQCRDLVDRFGAV